MTERFRLSIIAVVAILIVAVILAATVIATTGHSSDSTPVLVMLIGFVAPTVVALLALLGVERVGQQAEAIGQKADRIEKHVNDVEAKVDAN